MYLKCIIPADSTYVREIGDAHEETDGVKDVTLAGSVEPGDGVEGRVEAVDLGPMTVRLEAVDHHRFDVHDG